MKYALPILFSDTNFRFRFVMADWAGLHRDILGSILAKVIVIEDFIAFSCVCKSWMEAAANNNKYLRPQIPWLVLPDGENPRGISGFSKVYTATKNHHRQIYNLSKDGVLTNNLYIPEMTDKRCIGLNYGWVLTISRTGDLNLVHPLTRTHIQLPSQKSLDFYQEVKCWPSFTSIGRAALSANPSETSDFVVMILLAEKYLNYWRLGDERWTRVTNRDSERLICDLSYSQDRFYAIGYHGKVWACSVSDPQGLALVMDLRSYNNTYIVESNGELLVVVRVRKRKSYDDEVIEEEEEERVEDSDGDETVGSLYAELRYFTCIFKVYKLDLINGVCKEVESLGDCAIFVGHNTSISVDVSDFRGGLIKSNHIYFTDDHVEGYVFVKTGGGSDMGCYSLEDGQFTQFKVEELLSRINPPFWFIPSL